MWRCESRSLGANLKNPKIEFWAFKGPSGHYYSKYEIWPKIEKLWTIPLRTVKVRFKSNKNWPANLFLPFISSSYQAILSSRSGQNVWMMGNAQSSRRPHQFGRPEIDQNFLSHFLDLWSSDLLIILTWSITAILFVDWMVENAPLKWPTSLCQMGFKW